MDQLFRHNERGNPEKIIKNVISQHFLAGLRMYNYFVISLAQTEKTIHVTKLDKHLDDRNKNDPLNNYN